MIKKVAIIGGGIAGLTIAIGLQQRGYKVQVFERAKQFNPLGGDIGLWSNGLQVLNKLGLYDQIKQQSGGHYSKIAIGTEQEELLTMLAVNPDHKMISHQPMNICRYEFQEILVERLGIENIIFNKHCIHIEESAKEVTAHFHDGSSINTDLLIGADGAHSSVRNYIEPNTELEYGGYISLGGINTQPHHIKYNLIYGKNISGAFPVSHHRHIFFFVMQHTDCDLKKLYPSTSDQFNLFRHRIPLLDEMLAKLEKSVHSNNGLNYFFVKNYNLPPLQKWNKGRVVIIGDAAHLVGALLGCATSILLEGVEVLIRCLQQFSGDHHEALAMYQMIHKSRTLQLLQLEREFFKIFANHSNEKYLDLNRDLMRFLTRG